MHKHLISSAFLLSQISSKLNLLNPINKLYTSPREIKLLDNYYKNPSTKLILNELDIKLMDELFYDNYLSNNRLPVKIKHRSIKLYKNQYYDLKIN